MNKEKYSNWPNLYFLVITAIFIKNERGTVEKNHIMIKCTVCTIRTVQCILLLVWTGIYSGDFLSKLKNREEFEGGLKKHKNLEKPVIKFLKKQGRISTGWGGD